MRLILSLFVSFLSITSVCSNVEEVSQKTSLTRLRYSSLNTSPLYDAKGLEVTSALYQGGRQDRLVQPNTYFVTIVGEKGPIEERKGREGKIMVIAVSHEIVSPRDTWTGQASGKRQHTPLILTVPVGVSTPLLYNAFISGETLKSVTVGQYLPTNPKQTFNGETSPAFSTIVEDAQIAWIEMYGSMIEVGITYRTIKWKYENGGIEAVDTWQRS